MNFKNKNLLDQVIEALSSDVAGALSQANKMHAEPGSVMYHDYPFKIKVEADVNGNYRIYLKAPELMDLYVDITASCTSEFQQKLFAQFFKKAA